VENVRYGKAGVTRIRVRARPGCERDGADISGLRVASGRNCAKDASAEPSAAAPATMMTAVVRVIFVLTR
jgi:hypothetical protein